MNRRLHVARVREDPEPAVREALVGAGILDHLGKESRVCIKPNLTYPYHKPGVTTSPDVLRATMRVLREYTERLAIVETDGGYGAWRAEEAFDGHGIREMAREVGAEVVNLCVEPRTEIEVRAGRRQHRIPLPTRLVSETDLLLSMPVPKIHCMTGLSLAYKNQWGCIPDTMRLRRHSFFNEAILTINKILRPAVLGDGTYFLDGNGPLDGEAVAMGLLIAASDPGTFDRYVSELMGVPWAAVPHLRRAVREGDMPASLEEVAFNVHPIEARTRVFRLRRTWRNWIALAGFRNRAITWLGYESWFGRTVLHGILYAVAGRPVSPRPLPSVEGDGH